MSSCPGFPAQVTFTPVKCDTLTTSLPINQGHLLLALEQVCQRKTFEVRIPVLLIGCPMEKPPLDHLPLKMHQAAHHPALED